MESSSTFWLILLLAVISCVTSSVPDEFCLDHFDDGDCGEPPTSVLYYYKSGSRCEVRTWRGCPTLNKFPDYFSCVHFCVGRIWGEPLDILPLTASAEAEEHEKAVKIAEIMEAQNDWKEELKALKVEEIKVIDHILEDVVQEIEHQQHKLSLPNDDQGIDSQENHANDGEIMTNDEDEVLVA